MNCIPKKLRAELAEDPEYAYCSLTGTAGTRYDKIEWHHNLIFKGKQVQRKFAILPILHSIHAQANNIEMRERLDWIMWNRATSSEITEFSKAVNYHQRLEYLNEKFGEYHPVVPEIPMFPGAPVTMAV